ncbi:multidrug resistance-associated protein [Trichoderma atroviride IMI 206040]|uniref:Multidrug resistance-associated protein n=1 Tax=Hypocrea atroviridis (strain ATCC 20476 / IMI 206040) TaxID=452589 RepID=G9NNB1_HYPAI|nr:multidrug resistance-associated protein [Trichoderma atroviride IMI 206040]EHK47560.1 multidrug resistance-associated protein [Trichoderma atroviride IMI 206040]
MSCRNSDRSFGPQVDPRCRTFDFTLLFEDIFFVGLPAIVFLILTPAQIWGLFTKRAAYTVRSRALRRWKSIAYAAILIIQVIYLVFRSQHAELRTKLSLPADILSSVATVTAFLLSRATHERSLRPSTVLDLYLFLQSLLNIARTRTLWLQAAGSPVPVLMTVNLSLTLFALILESIEEKKPLFQGSPEEFSGLWARISFSWLTSLLRAGHAKIISQSDLPNLDTRLQSRVLRRQLITTWSKYDPKAKHSLLKACFRSHLSSLPSAMIPRLCMTAFTFSQPFLIKTTIEYVGSDNPNSYHGKGLIGAWTLVYLGIAISRSLYYYEASRFVAKLRGSLIALVYQRSLDIRATEGGDITAVALMGTDIERIASVMEMFHETWACFIDILIACWLLERQLSLACLAPIALVLVFIVIISQISVATQRAQVAWIEKVQDRLRATTALLGDIKAIKMLALPQVVSTLLTSFRTREIKTSKTFRELLIATLLLSLAPTNLAPAATFTVYVLISVFWLHESFFTAQAFTSIALIGLLTDPVIAFIQIMPPILGVVGSFDRIQEYCNYTDLSLKDDNYYEPGHTDYHHGSEIHLLAPNGPAESLDAPHDDTISLHSRGFKWSENGPVVLKDIQVDIGREAITAITGPVGSGKSSFLSSILGEMIDLSSPENRQRSTQPHCKHIAYCSQQPWLENKSIRRNILGSSSYEKKWYDEVVSACGLGADLKQLQRGDQTKISSRGLNLSGGQKQRIALARAIYPRNQIILLDDIFSGMDAHTIDTISTRLLGKGGILRKQQATVVLTTHHHKIMAIADVIIVLEDGKITAKDTPASLLQNNGYINKLGLQLISDNEDTDESVAKPATVPTTEEAFEIAADIALDISEETDGKHTDIRRKKGELSVYAYYLASSGWGAVILYSITVTGWILCIEFSTIWMKWWSDANNAEPNKDVWMYLGIYVLFAVVGTLSGGICAWAAFITIISRSAAQLHSNLLQTTLRAPFYSRSTSNLGELLNRFSRDLELVDMELPSNMVNYSSTLVQCIAKVVIISIFTRYLGVTIPFFAIIVYFLQSFYLHTSRQVRLLAIEAHAPLFTHFSESIAGATTIRAFGWQSYHQERNYRLIDASQKPVYLQSCIKHWLGFVLEMLTTVLVALLVATVIVWRERFSTGSIGVSLVTVIGFNGVLVRLVKHWTVLEPSIGAVSRIKRFTEETEKEEQNEKADYVPATWPQAGAIEFAGWTASYGLTTNPKPVLNGITLSIKAGDHVAICGRTGSGKTSLILSLLKMLEIVEGSISIDGVDTSTLSNAEVRSRINVVSQDAFILPGSIRFNVDPLNHASDEDIIQALRRVRLWSIVEEQGGIDEEIDLSSWSAGQKQLLCFARAMVKRSKILVLDEAMSNVDHEAEAIMQEIIDTDFKECTVLAVMHRLEHIRRYDKAALFGNGKLLEYGDPEALLSGDTNLAKLYSSYRS